MNADSGAKRKFNRKLLAFPVIIIVVVALVFSWQFYWKSSNPKSKVTLPALNLTLVGANGQQRNLTADDIAGFESYTGTGGFITSAGKITVGNYTGVPILTLLNLVGGITSSENVTVLGSDGYKLTFNYSQVQGQDLLTYDANTGAAAQTSQSFRMIIAYYSNGTNLPPGIGPLSVAFVGLEGFITRGAYWVHLVVKIEIIAE
jgi:hypothetical protein